MKGGEESGRKGGGRSGRFFAVRSIVLFLGVFVALVLGCGNFVYELSRGTAVSTAAVLRCFGIEAKAFGDVIYGPGVSLRIIGECTGFAPVAVLVAAVVCFPVRVRAKVVGVLAGVPAILVINQGRLLSLWFLETWQPGSLDFAHVYLWQPVMVVMTLAVWLVWLRASVPVEREG